MVLTYHLVMMFSIPRGVGEVRDDQALVRRCYVATLKSKKPKEVMFIESLELRDQQRLQREEPAKELVPIFLDSSDPSRMVYVESE